MPMEPKKKPKDEVQLAIYKRYAEKLEQVLLIVYPHSYLHQIWIEAVEEVLHADE